MEPALSFGPKINLNALRIAESAARLGSFTKAGEEQLITPSAVSQRISRLEDELQFKIFVRKGNTIQLTHEGQRLIGRIKPPLDAIELAGQSISREQQTQHLRLGLPRSFAIKWLLPRLGRFRKKHQDIQLAMTNGFDFPDLASQGLHAAITFGRGKFSNCYYQLLYPQNPQPLCSPALAQQQFGGASNPLTQAMLAGTTLIHSRTGTADWETWLASENRAEPATQSSQIFLDSPDLALEAAKSGLGLCVTDLKLAKSEIRAGSLVAPFHRHGKINHGKSRPGWYLLLPRSSARGRPVQSFQTWIQEEAHQHRQVSEA